jgi:hypothetical protein
VPLRRVRRMLRVLRVLRAPLRAVRTRIVIVTVTRMRARMRAAVEEQCQQGQQGLQCACDGHRALAWERAKRAERSAAARTCHVALAHAMLNTCCTGTDWYLYIDAYAYVHVHMHMHMHMYMCMRDAYLITTSTNMELSIARAVRCCAHHSSFAAVFFSVFSDTAAAARGRRRHTPGYHT